MREGLAYVRGNRIVLGCMALDMFAVIFAGATALLPVYATEILAVGPRGYGLLSSSLEIGALAMALFLLLRPSIDRAGPVLLDRGRDLRARDARFRRVADLPALGRRCT